jgi:hypothetical protein
MWVDMTETGNGKLETNRRTQAFFTRHPIPVSSFQFQVSGFEGTA